MGTSHPVPALPSSRAYLRHRLIQTPVFESVKGPRPLTSQDFTQEITESSSVFLYKSEMIRGKHQRTPIRMSTIQLRLTKARKKEDELLMRVFTRLDRSFTSYLRKFHVQEIFISGCQKKYANLKYFRLPINYNRCFYLAKTPKQTT